MKAAYAELDLLVEVMQPSAEGFKAYVVDEHHLRQDQLPPKQLPVVGSEYDLLRRRAVGSKG